MSTSQGFDCEVDDENWFSVRVQGSDLIVRMYSGEESADCTIGSSQLENLIEFLSEIALPLLRSAPH